jgi:predicted acylesterase/phospholipase RssA
VGCWIGAASRDALARHVDFGRLGTWVQLPSSSWRRTRVRHPAAPTTTPLTLDALVASATVPGLFPVVVAGDRLLVDGGVVQRAPIMELLDVHQLDRVLMVAAYAGEPPREATVQSVVERSLELALAREISRDVELARFRHPRVDVQLLTPSSPLRVRPLDFDGARLEALIALGRDDGRRCLEALGYPS